MEMERVRMAHVEPIQGVKECEACFLPLMVPGLRLGEATQAGGAAEWSGRQAGAKRQAGSIMGQVKLFCSWMGAELLL